MDLGNIAPSPVEVMVIVEEPLFALSHLGKTNRLLFMIAIVNNTINPLRLNRAIIKRHVPEICSGLKETGLM